MIRIFIIWHLQISNEAGVAHLANRNIFIYLGAFSSIKVPMLTFEIGFLGLKFSLLRALFTLPVFIIVGFLMEAYLEGKSFEVKQP